MKYDKNQAALVRLRSVTPGGAQTLSKRAERFPEGAFPVALERGDGAYVYDVDGNRYLDMICGLASMTLGYPRHNPRHIGECDECDVYDTTEDPVTNAVVNQIVWRGVTFSLATELEAEVAEKIIDMIPCAEMVRFVKTGSEATEAAIRIARKATGRDLILTVAEGYHSWHSWFQAVKPEHPGIPSGYERMVLALSYNDIDNFKKAFALTDCDGYRIAAVILEPCHYEHPAPGFLQGLRDLCNQYGAVLIFDEMVTGFRWDNGGAQEYFGVTPDLATFGKACANGYPLAFVCGRADLMQHADVVSGTFGGECLSLAACSAVLDLYKSEPVIRTLWDRGQQFRIGVNTAIAQLDLPAVCDGFAVKPRIRFTCTNDEDRNLALSLLTQEMARNGVLWHPAGGNISAAMTEEDISNAVDTCRAALYVTRTALHTGDWSALKGKPIQASSFVRKG